jgi:hypothetical protein
MALSAIYTANNGTECQALKGQPMKAIFATLLLAAFAASAADTAPISGKWQIHIQVSDRESDQTCEFKQDGNELTGSCDSRGGTVSVAGKVDGKKVTWTYKIESEAGQVTLNFRGAINADASISGALTVQEFGIDGQFTATQAK